MPSVPSGACAEVTRMKRGRVITEAWEQARLDEREAVIVTQRCLWCQWEQSGALKTVRDAHQQHRTKDHADRPVPARRKRYRPFRQFNSNTNVDDNIANARKQGAAGWAGPL